MYISLPLCLSVLVFQNVRRRTRTRAHTRMRRRQHVLTPWASCHGARVMVVRTDADSVLMFCRATRWGWKPWSCWMNRAVSILFTARPIHLITFLNLSLHNKRLSLLITWVRARWLVVDDEDVEVYVDSRHILGWLGGSICNWNSIAIPRPFFTKNIYKKNRANLVCTSCKPYVTLFSVCVLALWFGLTA